MIMRRPYGMYDAEYQIPAQTWITNANKTQPTSTPDSPKANVTTSMSSQKMQAKRLVFENIFLHCRRGPIKKPVAAIAMKFPKTYSMAKFVTRFFQGSFDNSINVPMKDRA